MPHAHIHAPCPMPVGVPSLPVPVWGRARSGGLLVLALAKHGGRAGSQLLKLPCRRLACGKGPAGLRRDGGRDVRRWTRHAVSQWVWAGR